jgi:hypothetical protein
MEPTFLSQRLLLCTEKIKMGFADDMMGSLRRNRGLQTKNRQRFFWQNEIDVKEGTYSFKTANKLSATEKMKIRKKIWQASRKREKVKIVVILLSILATLYIAFQLS